MYQPHIIEFHAESKDSSWYEKFELLKNKVEEFSKKKGLKVVGKSQEEIKKFIGIGKG